MTVDMRLSHRLAAGDANAVTAAIELFERHDPEDLDEAIALVAAFGVAPEGVVDEIVDAWDHYRLIRDMPWG